MSGIKRNLFFNFLLSLSQILVPLVSIPYIARVLDPEGIGRVGFIDAFTYYFVVIAEAGIMVYGIREVAKLRGDEPALKKLVGELIALHIRTSLLSLVLYTAGIALLWSKIADIRLLYFSFAFLLVNAWACEWYFIGREKFGYIALRSLLIRLGGLACIFLLIHQPEDYLFYYVIIAGSAIITGVWNIVMLYRETKFSVRKANWRSHLGKVWVTYLISLFYSIPLYIDHVILRLLSTATAVGFYTFSIRLLRISTAVISDSFLVFLPRVSSHHAADERDPIRRRLHQNYQLVMMLALPMGMGIYLLAQEITQVFFGDAFSSIFRNLQVLAFFPLLRSYSLFLSNPIMIAHGQEKTFLKNLIASTIVFFMLAFAGAFYLADYGICLAMLASDLFLIILNYISIRRSLSWLSLFDGRVFFQALGASVLFVPIVWLLGENVSDALTRLWLSIVVCIPVYFLVVIYLFRNWEMQQLLKNIISKFLPSSPNKS